MFSAVIESGSDAKLCASLLKPNESLAMTIFLVDDKNRTTQLAQQTSSTEFHRCFSFQVCQSVAHASLSHTLTLTMYFSTGSSSRWRISAETEGGTSREVVQNDRREESHVQTLLAPDLHPNRQTHLQSRTNG